MYIYIYRDINKKYTHAATCEITCAAHGAFTWAADTMVPRCSKAPGLSKPGSQLLHYHLQAEATPNHRRSWAKKGGKVLRVEHFWSSSKPPMRC